MPSRPVVVNNTPLVGLWNLGRLDLLTALFESVVIPSAVEKEFLAKGDPGRAKALRASGVATISVLDTRLARGFVGVDIGEAEVLALGHQLIGERGFEARLIAVCSFKYKLIAMFRS